jgi:hypothetical protein
MLVYRGQIDTRTNVTPSNSVSYYQCSVLIFTVKLLLPEEKKEEEMRNLKKDNAFSLTGEH